MCEKSSEAPGSRNSRCQRSESAPDPIQESQSGWGQQIRLVPQRAAQPRVPLTPRFEASGDRVEEPGFVRGPFVDGSLAEETRAQLRVPADVVPLAHLILEEPRQYEALRACHFHHQAVAQQGGVRHKMVEDLAEIRGGWPFDTRLCRYLSVVRQNTGVIKQLFSIDARLGHVPQA